MAFFRRLVSSLAIVVASLLFATAAAAQTPAYGRDVAIRALQHDGVGRSYGLYVPASYQPGRPAPLIVALHGRFSSGKAMHAVSGLADLAERRGAILLYPEVGGMFWNDGGHGPLERREPPLDDAGFIAAALAEVSAAYAVDPARIYLVGHDNGFAYSLACRPPFRLAGAAMVAGLMWNYQAEACRGGTPTPLLIVHGRRDEASPVGGVAPTPPRTARKLGVDDTLAAWAALNGCDPRVRLTGGDGAVFYRDCASGAPLAYVGVPGGAAAWFRDGEGRRLNRHGVNATELVERFLFEREGFALPQVRSRDRGRGYLLYAPPSYDPTRPTPLVVLLHGRPSNAASMAAITRMNAVAARNGFLVVYPEGINNEWNAFYDLTNQRAQAPQDDVRFLRDLVGDLARDLNIDRRRVYVGGFSNGGFMTYRLACSAADTFAAFAAVGANLYSVLTDECRGGRPVPILIMHGTADPSVPYNGVVVRDQDDREVRVSLGSHDTAAFFVRRNHCSQAGSSTTFPQKGRSPGTHVLRFVPEGCDAGAPVQFWIVNGGGHTWPGVPDVLDAATFGPTNQDIDAGEALWDFFREQTLPEAR